MTIKISDLTTAVPEPTDNIELFDSSAEVSKRGSINALYPKEKLYPFGVGVSDTALPGSLFNASNTNVHVPERIYYTPILILNPITVTELRLNVTSGYASTSIRLGIYKCAGPGWTESADLVLDAGLITGDPAGVKTISGLSTVLNPGYYFGASAWTGTTGSIGIRVWQHHPKYGGYFSKQNAASPNLLAIQRIDPSGTEAINGFASSISAPYTLVNTTNGGLYAFFLMKWT